MANLLLGSRWDGGFKVVGFRYIIKGRRYLRDIYIIIIGIGHLDADKTLSTVRYHLDTDSTLQYSNL